MLDKFPINILENIQVGNRLTKEGTKIEPQKPSNLAKEYWQVLYYYCHDIGLQNPNFHLCQSTWCISDVVEKEPLRHIEI